jgi:arylformamidase
MTSRLRYLSYELDAETPVFGANPPVRITVESDFTTGPYIQHVVETVNHNGSHVDVPRHFCPQGKTLSDLPPDSWFFDHVHVISLPLPDDHLICRGDLEGVLERRELADIDALIIRTGFGLCRTNDPERYRTRNPGFSASAAEYLLQRLPRLRGLLCDIPSYTAWAHVNDGIAFHQSMLGQAFDDRFVLLFEDIALPPDLDSVDELWAVPIRLRALDGAPVTVIARTA